MNKLYGNCRQAGRQANKHAKWDTIDNYSPPPWLKEPVGCSERLTPYPVDFLHLRRCDEDEDDDGSTHHFYLSGGESIGTKSKRAKVEATDGEEKLRLFTSRARHKMSKARVATLFITLSLALCPPARRTEYAHHHQLLRPFWGGLQSFQNNPVDAHWREKEGKREKMALLLLLLLFTCDIN